MSLNLSRKKHQAFIVKNLNNGRECELTVMAVRHNHIEVELSESGQPTRNFKVDSRLKLVWDDTRIGLNSSDRGVAKVCLNIPKHIKVLRAEIAPQYRDFSRPKVA